MGGVLSWGAGVEAGEQVGAVHAAQCLLDGVPVLLVVPEEILSLGQFLLFGVCGEHRLQRVGVQACEVGLSRDGHGRGGEVLHLLEVEIQFLGEHGQLGHVFLMAAGVRRDEVGNELLAQLVTLVHTVEDGFETTELLKRRFAHNRQNRVAGVLGRHFEPARDVEANQLLVELGIHLVDGRVAGVVHRQVIAHSAADERFLHLGQGIHAVVNVEQGTVIGVEVGAGLGMQARRATAQFAALQIASVHAIHVGAGSAQVADVALEVGHACDLLYLAHDGLLAA